ncbi:MAG: TetR/AcrR family transcriptional regulator [Actinomycetota bacterium]
MITEQPLRRGPGRPPSGGEDTRERILAEALHLFSAGGFRGTSLAEIGRAAGVSKATVLHHFDSKEALFVELLRRRDAGDGTRDATGATARGTVGVGTHDTPGVGSRDAAGSGAAVPTPREFMEGWVRLVARNETTPDLVALYASMSVGALDPAHPAHVWVREHWDAAVAAIVRVLEEGKAAGLVREEAPSGLLARIVVAAADGLQLQWLGNRADERPASMLAETRELLDLIADRWFVD